MFIADELEPRTDAITAGHWMDWPERDAILFRDKTFTRSDGSIVARLYERLTKASRRRWEKGLGSYGRPGSTPYEKAYRQGVYDAYKALQDELNA